MYLESIFIGGDIRSQLPEEAKKFDNIDKRFKEVSFAIASDERESLCCWVDQSLGCLHVRMEKSAAKRLN